LRGNDLHLVGMERTCWSPVRCWFLYLSVLIVCSYYPLVLRPPHPPRHWK